ncbi:uncharacterized protein LOC124187186 [Neodiprion fabricii]|uniref:uncharacterized protein LOC124187186 n=1 Tax=Neodiprion fabricii TaxID=2872261 RepID=UPI001ED8CCA9|nr:uncharacterized protein LOC124187186 [Neodiprion fabricii]
MFDNTAAVRRTRTTTSTTSRWICGRDFFQPVSHRAIRNFRQSSVRYGVRNTGLSDRRWWLNYSRFPVTEPDDTISLENILLHGLVTSKATIIRDGFEDLCDVWQRTNHFLRITAHTIIIEARRTKNVWTRKNQSTTARAFAGHFYSQDNE